MPYAGSFTELISSRDRYGLVCVDSSADSRKTRPELYIDTCLTSYSTFMNELDTLFRIDFSFF